MNTEKREYELTEDELLSLFDDGVGGMKGKWAALGEKYGFDPETVESTEGKKVKAVPVDGQIQAPGKPFEPNLMTRICKALIDTSEDKDAHGYVQLELSIMREVYKYMGVGSITMRCLRKGCDKSITFDDTVIITDLRTFYTADGLLGVDGGMECFCGGRMFGEVIQK